MSFLTSALNLNDSGRQVYLHHHFIYLMSLQTFAMYHRLMCGSIKKRKLLALQYHTWL
jgi:hypothetical protein